jgi:hypothetical protein
MWASGHDERKVAMREIFDQAARFVTGLPWAWISFAVAAIAACREIIRQAGFLAGLTLALRGTTGSDRIKIIEAYGQCIAAANRISDAGAPTSPSPAPIPAEPASPSP